MTKKQKQHRRLQLKAVNLKRMEAKRMKLKQKMKLAKLKIDNKIQSLGKERHRLEGFFHCSIRHLLNPDYSIEDLTTKALIEFSVLVGKSEIENRRRHILSQLRKINRDLKVLKSAMECQSDQSDFQWLHELSIEKELLTKKFEAYGKSIQILNKIEPQNAAF